MIMIKWINLSAYWLHPLVPNTLPPSTLLIIQVNFAPTLLPNMTFPYYCTHQWRHYSRFSRGFYDDSSPRCSAHRTGTSHTHTLTHTHTHTHTNTHTHSLTHTHTHTLYGKERLSIVSNGTNKYVGTNSNHLITIRELSAIYIYHFTTHVQWSDYLHSGLYRIGSGCATPASKGRECQSYGQKRTSHFTFPPSPFPNLMYWTLNFVLFMFNFTSTSTLLYAQLW